MFFLVRSGALFKRTRKRKWCVKKLAREERKTSCNPCWQKQYLIFPPVGIIKQVGRELLLPDWTNLFIHLNIAASKWTSRRACSEITLDYVLVTRTRIRISKSTVLWRFEQTLKRVNRKPELWLLRQKKSSLALPRVIERIFEGSKLIAYRVINDGKRRTNFCTPWWRTKASG